MKGYKIFDQDWKCHGFQFQIGKTYEMKEDPILCEKGFHFCTKLEDCFNYYDAVTWNHIAEIKALGKITDKKCNNTKRATNKIQIIREIHFSEIKDLIKNNGSDGVNGSNGVNESYGILNSFGVDHALFLANKPQTYSIFNKKVTEKRFHEVYNKLQELLGNWKPTFNNLKSLYLQYGNEWKRTPIPKAEEISKEEAWKDMPKEAIEYIKSISEFNKKMFKEITGIK